MPFPSMWVDPPFTSQDLLPKLGQEVRHIHLEVQAKDFLVAHLRDRFLHHVHIRQLNESLLPANDIPPGVVSGQKCFSLKMSGTPIR